MRRPRRMRGRRRASTSRPVRTVVTGFYSSRIGASSMPKIRYARLPTERSDPASRHLDRLDALAIARLMNRADRAAVRAVGRAARPLARAVDLVAAALGRGGRLVFVGAGTSGRLGIL